MNIFVTDHAASRALKRGGIRSGKELRRLYKEGRRITDRELKRQGLWNNGCSHELTRINGRHILFAEMTKKGIIIKTYVRKEKCRRIHGKRQVDRRKRKKYDRNKDFCLDI